MTQPATWSRSGTRWDIPVALPVSRFDGCSAHKIVESFAEAYGRFFGRAIEGLEIEIVSWSVKASSPLPPVERVASIDAGSQMEPTSRRQLFDAASGKFLEAGIHKREDLSAGDVVRGPAVIVESETSTVITAAFKAIVQRDDCLLVTRL